jgi:hypothetical protein
LIWSNEIKAANHFGILQKAKVRMASFPYAVFNEQKPLFSTDFAVLKNGVVRMAQRLNSNSHVTSKKNQ